MDVALGVTFLGLELVAIVLVLLELVSFELARSDGSKWESPCGHCAARGVPPDSLVAIRFRCFQKRPRLRKVAR
jgi:hypothetical protein